MYGESVVHEGESFVYSAGTWTDLTKYKIPGTDDLEEATGKPISELLATDNFSIKAYMVAKDSNEPVEQTTETVKVNKVPKTGDYFIK